MKKDRIGYKLLNEYLEYKNGFLIWKKRSGGRSKAGKRAGYLSGGYYQVTIFGKRIYSHRIVWILHHKKWPNQLIDHIDGNKLNNKIENLRDVSLSLNLYNGKKRKGTTSKYIGVSRSYIKGLKKKWLALVCKDGRAIFYKHFHTEEEAAEARSNFLNAKKIIHQKMRSK